MKFTMINIFLTLFIVVGCQEMPPPYNENERILRNTPSDYETLVIFKDWEKMDKRSYLRFTNIETIHIRQNVDSLPPWLNRFKKTKSLYILSKNLNKKEFPFSYIELNSLEFIMAIGCDIQIISPEIIKFKNLEAISLMDNKLTTLPDEIYELPNLIEIDLARNPFENPEEIKRRFEEKGVKVKIDIEEPPKPVNLIEDRIIDLIEKNLNTLPVELCENEDLIGIDADRNNITEIPLCLMDKEYFSFVNLSYNQIKEIPKEMGKSGLRKIDLSYNQIKEVPEEIYEMVDLYEINLKGNPLENPEEIKRRFEEKGIDVYVD